MCQSKADGGRRCDMGITLYRKQQKMEWLNKHKEIIPTELANEITALKKQHNEYEKEQNAKHELRVKLKEEKLLKRQQREENKKLKQEQKLLTVTNQPKATKQVQLYLTPKEAAQFKTLAETSFIEQQKQNNKLNLFLNTAAKRKAEKMSKPHITYEQWVIKNGETPEAYLNSNGLTIQEAALLTKTRLYDGVREKIENDITLTEEGNKAILENKTKPQVTRTKVGRIQSNFDNQEDNSIRNQKVDLTLTEEGHQKIERIAQIFGITKGDVLRNQFANIDHRIRQHHQSITKYKNRQTKIIEYETEGGKYRKIGEPLNVFYKRIIENPEIELN